MEIPYNYEVFPNIPLHFMCEGFDMSELESTNTSMDCGSYENTLKALNYLKNNFLYLKNTPYDVFDLKRTDVQDQHNFNEMEMEMENEMINVKSEPIDYYPDDKVACVIPEPTHLARIHSINRQNIIDFYPKSPGKKQVEVKQENQLPVYILKRFDKTSHNQKDRCVDYIGQKGGIIDNVQNLTNSSVSFDHLNITAINNLVAAQTTMQQQPEIENKKPFIFSYNDTPMNLTKKQVKSNPARRSYSKQIVQIENATDLQTIGPNGTQVSRELLDTIEWDDVNSATRKLLMMIFDRTTLATRSLTGKPSPAFVDFANYKVKERLDEQKIKDIIYLVKERTNALDKHIRQAITTKLADENKMLKQRAKKNQLMLKKQQEAAKTKSSQ